jgi:hypothetical protein
MFGGIVQLNRPFKVRQTFYDVSQVQQTGAYDAMRRQQQRRCSGERKKLCRKLTQDIAIEGYDVHGKESVEGRE